jgi:hypothetical protein
MVSVLQLLRRLGLRFLFSGAYDFCNTKEWPRLTQKQVICPDCGKEFCALCGTPHTGDCDEQVAKLKGDALQRYRENKHSEVSPNR